MVELTRRCDFIQASPDPSGQCNGRIPKVFGFVRRNLCLSKISKCLSVWELVFLHNSRRCSFFSRHSSHLWPRSSGRVLPSGSRTRLSPSNRRAPQVCRKAPQIDRGRPPALHLSVAPLARLALGVGHRQARNGRRLASCRLSFVLDLEGALRKTRTLVLCWA